MTRNALTEFKPLPDILRADLKDFIKKGLSAEAVRRFKRIGITNVAKLYDAVYVQSGLGLRGIGKKCVADAEKLIRKLGLGSRIGFQDVFVTVAGEARGTAEIALTTAFESKVAELKTAHDADVGALSDEVKALLGQVQAFQRREGFLRAELARRTHEEYHFRTDVTDVQVQNWLLAKQAGKIRDDGMLVTARMHRITRNGFPVSAKITFALAPETLARALVCHRERSEELTKVESRLIVTHGEKSVVDVQSVVRIMFSSDDEILNAVVLEGLVEFPGLSDAEIEKVIDPLSVEAHLPK